MYGNCCIVGYCAISSNLLFKFHHSDKRNFLCYIAGLQLNVCSMTKKFLVLNQNTFCGFSKEPSHWDGSFEHQKLMFELRNKKIFTILHTKVFTILGTIFCINKVQGHPDRNQSGWNNPPVHKFYTCSCIEHCGFFAVKKYISRAPTYM